MSEELPEDPLELLAVEKWADLQTTLKSDWPRSVSGYYILEIQRRWLQQGFDYEFKVFSPYGNVENGMVAIHKKVTFYEMFIECPKDTAPLENALRHTKCIDWKNKKIVLMFAATHIIECVRRIVKDIGVDIVKINMLNLYILYKQSPLFDVSLPPNIAFGPLSSDHIDLIDVVWPHRYPGSKKYFEVLIKNNFGFGLFKNKELISWTFIKETGALGHIYTLEEHRKNVYGEMVVKLVCNELMQREEDVFSFVSTANVNSCKMHEKLQFVKYSEVGSCYFASKEQSK